MGRVMRKRLSMYLFKRSDVDDLIESETSSRAK
jgi:hypothetical protein